MQKPSFFITGGAGFIGSRLVSVLSQAHAEASICVFDNLHPQVHGQHAKPPAFPARVKFIRGDVTDAAALHTALNEASPTVVYHLAAETGTGQSYDEPARYCEVNVQGTANLVEGLRKLPGCRQVILAASRAVYGEGGYRDVEGREYVGLPRQPERMRQGDFTVQLPHGAKMPGQSIASHAGLPPAPASVYASTKLMQEYLLTQTGEGATWKACMLRFQNVYGPGQSLRNPYTGVLSMFARQLLSGGELVVFEDGEIARDFVFVSDVVDALMRAANSDLEHGEILDIGSGEASTILNVARILMRVLKRDDHVPRVTGHFRVGDIRYACADITRARRLLGWQPDKSLTDGLTELAEWARLEYIQGNI